MATHREAASKTTAQAGALPVENPGVRHTASSMGIKVTTDKLGKDTGDTSMGVMVESRYFLNGTLVERHVAPVVTAGRQFWWIVAGEEFTTAEAAFRHILAA